MNKKKVKDFFGGVIAGLMLFGGPIVAGYTENEIQEQEQQMQEQQMQQEREENEEQEDI